LSKNRELKTIELRLVAELMKNSHRSDRDLAKALKISQPTVTRMRNRLEKEGVIREYTVIPDFSKLGYEILGITLALSKPLEKEEIEKAREVLLKDEKEKDFEFIMMERGIGASFDGVDISLHPNLSSFQEYLRWLRKLDFLEVERTQFFLVDLMEKSHYRPFTFSAIAKHIEKRARKIKKMIKRYKV
jgi:DNA-binding Lrp family transcriptional regulator